MKQKSLILYGAEQPLTNSHKLVTGWRNQPEYYVRAETFNGDCREALDKSKPMEGETVLNTVDISKSQTQ